MPRSARLPTSHRNRARQLCLRWLSAMLALAAVLVCAGAGMVVIRSTWREQSRAQAVGETARSASVQTAAPSAAPAGRVDAAREIVGGMPSRSARGGMDPDAPNGRMSASPSGRWAYAAPPASGRWTPSFTRASLPRVVALPPASALGFGWPLRGVITSLFSDAHPLGIDIAPLDSLGLVLAGRDGVVVYAGGDPCCSYGYYVMIDHGDGLTSIYGHLRDRPLLEPGDRVVRGTVLGVAGDTGHSIGVHLHFEVRVNGVPVDPELVLTAGQLTPLTPVVRDAPAPADEDTNPSMTAAPEGTPQAIGMAADEEPPSSPAGTPPAALNLPMPAATPPPTATPTPTATATPVVATTTPAPRPVASAVATQTSQPGSSPSLTPAMATLPPVRTSTVLQPPSAPVVLPTTSSDGRALPEPAPSRTPSLPAAASTGQDLVRTATATTPDTPPAAACAQVRMRPPSRQLESTDPSAFITLSADEAAARTLVAERCGADGAVTVKVTPEEGRICVATLRDSDGKRLRILQRESPRVAEREIRWAIDGGDLNPGTVVQVSCAAPVEPNGA